MLLHPERPSGALADAEADLLSSAEPNLINNIARSRREPERPPRRAASLRRGADRVGETRGRAWRTGCLMLLVRQRPESTVRYGGSSPAS
ncbi:MAG: hypothetical protein C4345_01060 [Chloroflexota bacterium]